MFNILPLTKREEVKDLRSLSIGLIYFVRQKWDPPRHHILGLYDPISTLLSSQTLLEESLIISSRDSTA